MDREEFKINRLVLISVILLILSLACVSAVIIGGKDGGYFNGTIDEVRVWSRALSMEEVKQSYASNLYMDSLESWGFYSNQSNLTYGEYSYYGYVSDIMGNENFTEVRSVIIISSLAPSVPILISPNNGNDTLFDRNVMFNWTDSVDNSDDPITYDINITSESLPDISGVGIVDSNYTLDEELDVDIVYNWSVRACDYELCSDWSESWNFTVASYVIINLTANETNFGTIVHGEVKNTTSGVVEPFIVENLGNVITDVELSAQESIWGSVELNTSYFQFMAGNSSEDDSFNWEGSQTIWGNMSNVQKLVVNNLKYYDAGDSAEIEFQIEVPIYEVTGEKKTDIVVMGVIS